MKNTIDKKKAPVRVNVGGLYFDELKIKEGLVWDPHTWEMIGFVDLDINENGEDTEDHLATHILQFFYRSLFYKFEYPFAYILTNNTTAETLNHLFWTGVSQLEQEHINIMVVCCDGASENRKMINMNLLNDTGIGYNPFSHLPMFFISDPPHLLKKLRNNLFKSGDMSKERFTRHLAERYEESKDLYIIPNRINQDFVESFFSRQRQLCGGTQNMTSHAYGYNINSCLTISSSRLVKYKQTNVMEVKECQAAVEEKSTLPKRRSKNSLLENIICPLDNSGSFEYIARDHALKVLSLVYTEVQHEGRYIHVPNDELCNFFIRLHSFVDSLMNNDIVFGPTLKKSEDVAVRGWLHVFFHPG